MPSEAECARDFEAAIAAGRCPMCGTPAGTPATNGKCLWRGHQRMPPAGRGSAREAPRRALMAALAACTPEEIEEALAIDGRLRQSA
jgi:hypothetical protein